MLKEKERKKDDKEQGEEKGKQVMRDDVLEAESQEIRRDDCSFVWDQSTQLYFHASSGFYHDPNAGWYYSSRDGLYYKFENGSYVLLESEKVDGCETQFCRGAGSDSGVQDKSYTHANCNSNENFSSFAMNESDACQCGGTVNDDSTLECSSNQAPENPCPPSEWLEETLINLYLSGYNLAVDAADGSTTSLETDANNDNHKLDEGYCITKGHLGLTGPGENIIDEDSSKDEENWRALYGQVVHSGEEPAADFAVVDLWDWEMVTCSRADGKGQVARLAGRLVKLSAKLHPSMPSSGGLFKTAPISEVHLDMVRVRTGQVYKLCSPSARYLASLTTYDSSNPTKGWGFPQLSINAPDVSLTKRSRKSEPKSADGNAYCKGDPNQLSSSKKQKNLAYRDRAAERRTLHGGFGVGPGQKSTVVGDVGGSSSPVSTSTEEAAAEALNISFGAGSYARKILESMGWKEGEALGNTMKGLVEPIEAVGNIGNAGLGWPQGRMKHH